VVRKTRASLRQLVNIRRPDLAISAATGHPGAQTVGNNQDDIRAWGGAFFARKRRHGQRARYEIPAV
jgi:hypothetical protein